MDYPVLWGLFLATVVFFFIRREIRISSDRQIQIILDALEQNQNLLQRATNTIESANQMILGLINDEVP